MVGKGITTPGRGSMSWFPRHGTRQECPGRTGSTALVNLYPEVGVYLHWGVQSGCALGEGSSLSGGDAGKDSDQCVWRLL